MAAGPRAPAGQRGVYANAHQAGRAGYSSSNRHLTLKWVRAPRTWQSPPSTTPTTRPKRDPPGSGRPCRPPRSAASARTPRRLQSPPSSRRCTVAPARCRTWTSLPCAPSPRLPGAPSTSPAVAIRRRHIAAIERHRTLSGR
eukprot:1187869-Prorocentrum_minimum.AAC.1